MKPRPAKKRKKGGEKAGALAQQWPYYFVSVLYLLLAVLLRWNRGGGVDWDSYLASTDLILKGQWLHLYENHQGYFSFIFTPLPFFLLAPFRFVGQALGLSPGPQAALMALPMIAGDLLSAVWLVRLVRRFRPAGEGESLFLFTLFLTAWVVFFDSAYHSHFESILLLFFLLFLERLKAGHSLAAGFFLGLALLTKQTALIPAIPCFLALGSGRPRKAFWQVLGAAVLTVLTVMAPFLIADFKDVKYVLMEEPNQLPVGYQTVWWVFAGNGEIMRFLNGAGPLLNGLILALSILYSWGMARLYGIGLKDGRLIGLCAGCVLIMVTLERWGSLHYFLVPFALLLAWEAVTTRWPWVSILFAAFLSHLFVLKYSVETHFGFNEATAWFMILLFFGTLGYFTHKLRAPAGEPERQ